MTDSAAVPEAKTGENSFAKIFIVALLFFLSGASSLIYQVIWTRQMVFVFGSSTFASATVLSSFMGGLALGSFVAGKYADKMRNPFIVYGILEGIIGLWALAAPFMFDAALPLYKAFYLQMHLQILPFSILRFLVVALILLVPTACMGATLPILSRFITNSLKVVGERVGTLYAINTLGAVFGATAGGFYLIPEFGLSVATMAAAGTNVLLTVIVVALSKSWASFASPPVAPLSGDDKSEDAKSAPLALPKPALYTVIAFGISGAIAMVYEVAWTRALLLVIGSTTYAFSIMLSTFLLGIFLGSFVASRLADKVKDPVFWFGLLQVLLGIAGVVSIVMFTYLPYWNILANHQNYYNPQVGMAVRFLLAGAVLVPVTIFLGATFPLAVKSCSLELERIGNSVGTLYSVNTLGAIIGSFAGGFIIIPALGGEQTLITCAMANAMLGAGLLLSGVEGHKVAKILSSVVAVGLLVWTAQQPKVWNLYMLTSSQKVRRGMNFVNKEDPVQPFGEWAKVVESAFDILFFKDGLCANVAVVQFKDKQKSLFTNGHIDASDGTTDMPTQVLLPAIPLFLKPGATDVADVGWGSGCTMGYALLFPIKNMVCAEIEPAVIETSKFFHDVNLAPEKDSRLRIEYNDGRNFLLATDEKFDVITSEPSNPWQAGVCNLYTQQYFQVCHDRLKPGGVFTMWWQCNEVSSNNLLRVFKALKGAFKHLCIFQTFPGDIAAVASDEPIKINIKSIEAALAASPKLREKMAQYGGIAVGEDLPLKVLMADDAIDKLIANVPANTDDRNYIEFDVAKTYEQKNYSLENAKWFVENSGSVWDVVDWGTMTDAEKASKMAGISERGMVRDSPLAQLWATQSYKVHPNAFALCVQALIYAQKKGDFDQAFALADFAVKHFPGDVRPVCVRGIVELLAGAPLRARKDFEEALKSDPDNKIYKFRLAQTYMPELRDWYQIANLPMKDIGKAETNPAKVLELVSPVLNDTNFLVQNPAAIGIAANAYLLQGKTDEAFLAIQNFLRVRRDDLTGLRLMAQVCTKKGDARGADYCNQKVAELSKVLSLRLVQNGAMLAKAGRIKYAIGALKRALDAYPASAEARQVLHQIAKAGDPDAATLMKTLAGWSFEDLQAYKELEASKAEKKPAP